MADEVTPPEAFFWTGIGDDQKSTSSAGSNTGASLENIAVVDDRLRGVLKDRLGVVLPSPERVYGKKMTPSDRVVGQSRFQMSCKSWHSSEHGGDPFPIDEILTPEEKLAAVNPNTEHGGLPVRAYDRAGRPYDMQLKHLDCVKAYRLMTQWGKFLKENGLDVVKGKKSKEAADANPAMIDLWAFRSPKLEIGQDGHEDGRLGLVIVHYFRGDAPHADAAFEADDELKGQGTMRKKKKGGATAMEDLPKEQPVGVDEHSAAAVVVNEEPVQVQGGAPEPPLVMTPATAAQNLYSAVAGVLRMWDY
uniref:Uncharacterized protein n=1 Tax=Leersia perrieri TaxID=77586 RepID=A0A0D9WE89_9ORYZ